ncbi:MAG: Hint domain-containing protein [Paracoccaceae bacterium]
MSFAFPVNANPALDLCGVGAPNGGLRSQIQTSRGARSVAELIPGNLVRIRSGGTEPLVWVGLRQIEGARMTRTPQLRPVLIRAGSLGEGRPGRDMLVSPQQRVFYDDPRTRRWFGEGERPVPAIHLTCLPGVEQVSPGAVIYKHLMFHSTEAVLADGIWLEAQRADDPDFVDCNNEARQELLRLYPELVTLRGWTGARPAPDDAVLAQVASRVSGA